MIEIRFPSRHDSLNIEDYHSKIEALSRSDIVRILRSPLHFKEYRKSTTEAPFFRIGRALHGVVLEDVQPIVNLHDGRTKVGKEFQAVNPKAIPLGDAELVRDMAKRCRSFFQGVRKGRAEVSFFWKEGSICCKCRPDWVEDGIVYDLKTTRRDVRNFCWDIRDYSLDIQAAWYLRGVSQHEPVYAFRFVVIEKEPPHGVMVYKIKNLIKAREKIGKALGEYQHCVETEIWPGYDTEVQEVEV